MARGAEGKSARKQARKEARAKEAERILNGHEDVNEFSNPMTFEDPNTDGDSSSSDDDDDDDNDDDDSEEEIDVVPEKTPEKSSKSKSKSSRAKKAAAQRAAASKMRGDCCATGCAPGGGGGGGGIKTLPLVMLIMLTGTTVLPALLYAGDFLAAFAQKNHLLGNLGYRLGVGPSPKKRVISFYEKHDPEKVADVSGILAKYYGDYPKLIKRLERKYNDYGYFMNWEQDEAPMNLAFEKLWETRDVMATHFDRYAPPIVKTGARNMRHNLGFLYKKGRTVWKKTIWPVLKPHLGVPDEKAARAQKLKDAKEANRRKKQATGQRRKNADFRDDDEM